MNRLQKTVARVKQLLSVDEIPMKAGKTNFSEEQKGKLTSKLGEQITDKVIKAIDRETEKVLKDQQSDEELSAIREELQEALKDTSLSEEDAIEIIKQEASAKKGKGAKAKEGKDGEENLTADVKELVQSLISKTDAQDQMIQKLLDDSEGDNPIATGKANNVKMKHSNTHLFSVDKQYNAYEGRNWNKRAAGLTTSRTDFAADNGVAVQNLNEDLDHYYRENPEVIRSLHRDNFGLPSDWSKKTDVDDQVADGSIVTGEITQARKLPWLPKNKQAIKAEIGQIFPAQIDAEFVGKMLQDLESSWLNKFVGGGSQPYKDSFVAFLVQELDKKARQEDRMASIKGVYVETPDDATEPGKAIHRMNGLLYILWEAFYVKKKFRAANIGAPTKENVVDYVYKLIESNLSEEVRNMPGLKVYMSFDWVRDYKSRYKQINGLNNDFTGPALDIDNYENIKIEGLRDLAGSNFMFITWPSNIQVLEKIPAEKSMYRFEKLLRIIYVMADYKLGIRMIHIGNKVAAGDPDSFKVQSVWSNGQPMFKTDFFVPSFDNTTGELDMKYSNMKVASDWKTDITKITGTFPGEVVRIQGNEAATKAVKKNSQLLLDTDFDLSTGGTLTLFINEDGKAKEISRTTEPEVTVESSVEFNDSVLDANDGSDQFFNGNNAVTLTEILNGTEMQELTITAKTTGGLTINAATENVKLTGVTALLDTVGDEISFVKVDGVFVETSRSITA